MLGDLRGVLVTSDQQAIVGQRIRQLREGRGMSLGELETASGVTKGYLSQLERGEAVNPSVEAVRKIAYGLGAPVTELLGEDQEAESPHARMPAGFKAFLADAESRGVQLTDDDVKNLLAIRYRGRQPKTADDWSLLYDFIKRIVG